MSGISLVGSLVGRTTSPEPEGEGCLGIGIEHLGSRGKALVEGITSICTNGLVSGFRIRICLLVLWCGLACALVW